MECFALSASVIALGTVIGAAIFGRRIFDMTFEEKREATFRKTLRGWDYSDAEIEKAVKEQGW